ncbi:MAG TPA: SIMPL domain-containing protein, partial [Draconibacterium sp.]|nr:SIMPL domain-containing protein [Draconibacterium sp.]
NAKGIKSMRIAELKHSGMDKFKKEVKIQALQNAREKATYLLESIGEEPDKVQTIVEMSGGYPRPVMAKTMMMSAEAAPESIDQIQNITLSYQVQVRFGIK